MCREWKGPRGELLVRGSIEGHLAVVYRRIPTAFPENIPGSRILLLSDGIWCWYFVYIVIDRWFFVAPPSSSLGEKKFKVIKMVTLEIFQTDVQSILRILRKNTMICRRKLETCLEFENENSLKSTRIDRLSTVNLYKAWSIPNIQATLRNLCTIKHRPFHNCHLIPKLNHPFEFLHPSLNHVTIFFFFFLLLLINKRRFRGN